MNTPNENLFDPSQSTEAQAELEPFRRALLAQRARVAATARVHAEDALHANNPDAVGDSSKTPLHPADLGSELADQHSRLTLVEREEAELLEIDNALNRLATGTYGVCEECEEPIARRRLEALPQARYCIMCEEELEQDAADGYQRSNASPPISRAEGQRDLQRDYVNLYELGTPPEGAKEMNSRDGEYNEAFGRGGFPAAYYGRDSRPDLASDEPKSHEGSDEDGNAAPATPTAPDDDPSLT